MTSQLLEAGVGAKATLSLIALSIVHNGYSEHVAHLY